MRRVLRLATSGSRASSALLASGPDAWAGPSFAIRALGSSAASSSSGGAGAGGGFNPFDPTADGKAGLSAEQVFDKKILEDKEAWERRRRSILSVAADAFVYGRPAAAGLPAAPQPDDSAAAGGAARTGEDATAAAARRGAAAKGNAAREAKEEELVTPDPKELPPNLVFGADGRPRLLLYKAPKLPFHSLRVLMAMSLPLSVLAMLAGKMVFAGGSTHEAVAQLAYSALFWGLVAMPQLIGPSFIGELSVLFQEHKIRVGVLDWRGKRKDVDVPLLHFIPPMMEMSDSEKEAVWNKPFVGLIKVHGRRLPMYVSLKSGEIPDRQMLTNLLEGRVHERYLQRLKAEREAQAAGGEGREGQPQAQAQA